jgi:XTP/dITP diphosphohydrolase
MKLLFATQNEHKISEIKKILSSNIAIQSLGDLKDSTDIPETGSTLEENALLKARYVYSKFNQNCFADDTGLEVEALNGAPGVYSARYAGEPKSDEKNMIKLLEELKNKTNRKAHFKCVIALILDGKEILFEGILNGEIIPEKSGTNGFGYDPVFLPENSLKTLAEMSMEEKNKISHRAIAVKKLVEFLNKI